MARPPVIHSIAARPAAFNRCTDNSRASSGVRQESTVFIVRVTRVWPAKLSASLETIISSPNMLSNTMTRAPDPAICGGMYNDCASVIHPLRRLFRGQGATFDCAPGDV